MDSTPRSKRSDESGIALFMVLAAISILSVIVTEFTYVAQVNARSTADSSDQNKAHYLAKTGLKLSLLRLRAYKELKSFGKSDSKIPTIPRPILEQIWSFPFFYPIPSNAPGLTMVMKDEISKFTSESSLPGNFTATIQAESTKIGINSLLKSMAPLPAPNPSARPTPNPTPTPSATPANYDVEEARKGFREFLVQLLEEKFRVDPDFADEYRDLQVDELYDNILGWLDYTHQPRNGSGRQVVPYKRAPMYSLTELRMIYPIDDGLYELLAPHLTPFITPGINVNRIEEGMLRILLPGITDPEVKKFFEDRDSTEIDGNFKNAEEFFKYVETNIGTYRSSTTLSELRTNLSKRGIRILTDEEIFKITVVAEVNKATRILEAWVILQGEDPSAQRRRSGGGNPTTPGQSSQPGQNPGNPDPNNPTPGVNSPRENAAGLRLLYMRES